MDCIPLGSSVHGILQAGILESVAISSPGDLPGPGIGPTSPAWASIFFTTEPPGKSRFILCDLYYVEVNMSEQTQGDSGGLDILVC